MNMTITNDFWQERWEKQEIGFHEPRPHAFLKKYIAKLALPKHATVFVPFCGASVDMTYLLEEGYGVIGSELSSIACEAFFAENQLKYSIKKQDDFKIYQGDNITLYCGDHYQLKSEWFTDVKAVYDRAALVAVHPSERDKYIAKVVSLIPHLKILLITIEYLPVAQTSPPFSITQYELKKLLSDFSVTELDSTGESTTCQRLRVRQLQSVVERIYLIEKASYEKN